jgi:hypothetical protein
MLTAAPHVASADDRFAHMSLVTIDPVARSPYERVGFTLRHEMRSLSTEPRTLRRQPGPHCDARP